MHPFLSAAILLCVAAGNPDTGEPPKWRPAQVTYVDVIDPGADGAEGTYVNATAFPDSIHDAPGDYFSADDIAQGCSHQTSCFHAADPANPMPGEWAWPHEVFPWTAVAIEDLEPCPDHPDGDGDRPATRGDVERAFGKCLEAIDRTDLLGPDGAPPEAVNPFIDTLLAGDPDRGIGPFYIASGHRPDLALDPIPTAWAEQGTPDPTVCALALTAGLEGLESGLSVDCGIDGTTAFLFGLFDRPQVDDGGAPA